MMVHAANMPTTNIEYAALRGIFVRKTRTTRSTPIGCQGEIVVSGCSFTPRQRVPRERGHPYDGANLAARRKRID